MKIWIFNHYASPPDRPAGTRHYDLGRVLAAQGHSVTIFASSFSHFSREERLAAGERARIEDVDGVRFVWLRTTEYSRNDRRRVVNMLSYAWRAIAVQRRMERPDVVVGSSVHLAAVAAAWLVALVRRVNFVFEVRDLWPQTLIDIGALREGSLAARLLQMAEKFFYRRAQTVICLLPLGANYIAKCGIPRAKVVYVPNGIADDRAEAMAVSDQSAELIARIQQWREGGYLVAGYVGSHGAFNGVSDLVRAAHELRERGEQKIALIFVGDGTEKAACHRLARHYGLENVLFWPPVPKREVRAILQVLDVMLFCVRDVAVFNYGLSCNKLFDYLASGRPVVFACAVADGPVRESGGGICVDAESPTQVADALVTLAGLSEPERLAIGARGRAWVYQHHGTTALAGRFLRALSGQRQ